MEGLVQPGIWLDADTVAPAPTPAALSGIYVDPDYHACTGCMTCKGNVRIVDLLSEG